MSEIQGWINLYKPKNISSFKAINKIKKKFLLKKIGHAGTLDPLAKGILPVAIGKATKLISFVNNDMKKYYFTICWGIQTSSDDSDGEILNRSKVIPKLKEIEETKNKFLGLVFQIPPKVSAIKINGQRAYKLVRKKQDFSISPKEVFAKKIEVLSHKKNETSFSLECGKGFYIRSFARDIATKLGTFGHISSLERTKVGNFTRKTSILLDDLLKIGQRLDDFNYIKTSISMLDDILAYEIGDKKDLNELSFGRPIKINEENIINSSSKTVDKKNIFLSNNGNIVSIGKLEGNLFKPNKILI